MRTNQTLCAILAAMTPMLWAVTAAAAANTIDPGGAPVIAVDRDDYRGPAPTESFLQKAGRKTGDFFTDYVEIGLALNFYFPVDDQRSPDDTYLGTIDELKLTTGPLSINSLRVQFLLPKDFRIELGWADFEFETRTIEGDTDGTFSLNGPRVIAIYRPDFHSYAKPVFGLGFALQSADFNAENAFYNGFSGENKYEKYDDWVDSGAEPWPNNGYRKNIEVDDPVWALYLRLGLDITYFENWVLGADYEYIRQDMVGDYVLSFYDNPFRTTPNIDFPASLHTFSIYVRYDF